MRISSLLLLLVAICMAVWWWPRRAMIAVWWAGGVVSSNADYEQTIQMLRWGDPSGTSWGWMYSEEISRVLSWTRTDGQITGASLWESHVDDQSLRSLRRFDNLKSLGLHNRQLGEGLEYLRNLDSLTGVQIKSASDRGLAELHRLPHLRSLGLWGPQSGDIGLVALNSLPNLRSIFIGDCPHTSELLSRLPELLQLKRLTLQNCHGFLEGDFASLQRLPNLEFLSISFSAPVGDEGLDHISRLQNLETLCIRCSSGQITDAGLQALQELRRLKLLVVLRGDLTPQQVQTLQELLPDVAVRVN